MVQDGEESLSSGDSEGANSNQTKTVFASDFNDEVHKSTTLKTVDGS